VSHDPKSKDFDPYSAWLGIAPGTRPPTPEELVGVPPGEMDADRILNAGMARKKRLDGFALSEHRKLADAINKEVAEAVSLLHKRAESAPKPVEPIQAELAVEAITAVPLQRPAHAAVDVAVGVRVETAARVVVPAAPVRTVAGEPVQDKWRLDTAAAEAGIVVLKPTEAEPRPKAARSPYPGFFRVVGRLALVPFWAGRRDPQDDRRRRKRNPAQFPSASGGGAVRNRGRRCCAAGDDSSPPEGRSRFAYHPEGRRQVVAIARRKRNPGRPAFIACVSTVTPASRHDPSVRQGSRDRSWRRRRQFHSDANALATGS
jgi:hypothetical protein